MASKPRHEYDTIIIGAGISGLACASRLYEHNYYKQKGKLLVLEARDRIGGRIAAVDVLGNRLDTGANWIHGVGTDEKPNPLVSILPHKRYRELSGTVVFGRKTGRAGGDGGAGCDTRETPDGWVKVRHVEPESTNSDQAGDLIVPSEVAGPLSGALWQMLGSLHETAIRTSPKKAKATTMLDAVVHDPGRKEMYATIPKAHHGSLDGMPQTIEGIEAAPLVAQSAEHLEDQPSMSLAEYALDDFEGDQVFLQDGYTAVVHEVARQIATDGIIQTGIKVEQIRWDEDPIRVVTDSGIFTAKQLVCSLPLGVLKHEQKTTNVSNPLFLPRLPEAKTKAMSSLGYGTLDKIFMVYDNPWWNHGPYLDILKKGLVGSTTVAAQTNSDGDIEGLDTLTGFTDELSGIA
ncbi:hypothetical protein LTR62_001495 [Meristemomyces frigidus]|uniref:Amine oxidase domain-containing protein n=1 Tax=Meristemomyces frigidus TaxID=1508187 RepID=A0AAN7TSM1_9PEZI|nr:hypothetical protein LTR62_001495 [Meristemomyces frigidus]